MKRVIIVVIILFLAVLSVLPKGGFFNSSQDEEVLIEANQKEEPTEDTNQESEVYSSIIIEDISVLEMTIEDYLIDNEIDYDDISITIVDLVNTENTIRINSDSFFTAASIYKLPFAMVYYDLVNENQLSMDDVFEFTWAHVENDWEIAGAYWVGSDVPLSILLSEMIIDSDNNAAHILYENLGGWESYKEIITKYSHIIIDADEYYSEDNYQTGDFMTDVLLYLFEHQEEYVELIEYLIMSEEDSYLNLYNEIKTAQKYGLNGEAMNSVGVMFDLHPYSIVILSNLSEDGEYHLGRLSRLCFDFFNPIVETINCGDCLIS